MQSLYDELRINIFKYVITPSSLVVTNREWFAISQDPHAKAEWLINKYGKAHALFHAVRLRNFMTDNVVQALIARDAIISRYFVQRLLMHFGTIDEKLTKQKIEYNVHNVNNRSPWKKSWASNLTIPVFTNLITKCYEILNDNELAAKGNDMELFHFLSAGPLTIYHAPQRLYQNLVDIKDLILNRKFVPFPPRKKPIYEDTIEFIQLIQDRAQEDYPPKDGYENSRQLNVIARAILIYPDLVIMWKEIGYYEICSDLNELVMQGALLILFPPTPPINWVCPNVDTVIKRLKQLIDLGFQLNDIVMEDALHIFEHRLDRFGDILMDSFHRIHKRSISSIASSCITQAIKPERNHRKTDLLEFLISKIDEQPEKALNDALEHYNVGFNYDNNSIKSVKMRSSSVHSNVYYWILKKYGSNSEITQKCFEDILESRIWIDLKLQETPGIEIPDHLTKCAFNSICSIYLEFCNERIPFKANHLSYLKLVENEEIIKPCFELSLPILFGLELNSKLPYDINYECNRPDINNYQNNNSKRKYNDMDEQLDRNEWIKSLELYNNQITVNSIVITSSFKNNFKIFWERIKSSRILEINNDEISSKRSKQ
ncbi:uncharacterized protein OCT59_010613 [Rhizophagus irregularis]|nr:hypothetical protein GLOIN_2v1786652 [Rhizophagus irregularis DAOM 181602=DAOM 197198]EXX55878.1 hypothetical protein RirG_221430 [Rhizophagus irregularis DAOM 197198w]POG61427.1 hypothetical protein GLOIN_2v1786652 [Rhizophagus irregularis DAOM 181602=DAOM 197198]UZO19316.1 hypothetical protein OCT59_010613 [Rhizophagus irregularis]|eukprot:XP_025168293.1 hypothetical protein GLOIN_2v1786652 [Rhizophagus irregularis DAOM 181602=DAOM 197198]